MPSKIQQIAAMLDGLDNYELESIRSIANQVIENRRGTSCKLLALPPELRNLIYYFVARDYLKTYRSYNHGGDCCGLLSANKQLRIEFMDVCYHDKTVGEIQLAMAELDDEGIVSKMSWKAVQDDKTKKFLLDGGERSEFLSYSTYEGAEKWARICIENDAYKLIEGMMSSEEVAVVGMLTIANGDDEEGFKKYSLIRVEKKAILDYLKKGLERELPAFDDLI